jgi:UDP-N-acetylenolpyruvoylglucosamine reductase
MTLVKLNSKAQKIVNQIMFADTIDISHGPIVERIPKKDISLTYEGLECIVDVDGEVGKMLITNNTLNAAEIVDGFIEIEGDKIEDNEYGYMTISLYTLQPLPAKIN